jgi:hypothetical protein
MTATRTRDSDRSQEVGLLPYYCTATNRQGNRCGNRSIPGGRVCKFHGGGAPQVRAKAAERIRLARDLALDRLIEQLAPGEFPIDPKALADITEKFTRQIELLEGRATERKEVHEAQAIEVRHRIEGEIERLAHMRHEAQVKLDIAAREG